MSSSSSHPSSSSRHHISPRRRQRRRRERHPPELIHVPAGTGRNDQEEENEEEQQQHVWAAASNNQQPSRVHLVLSSSSSTPPPPPTEPPPVPSQLLGVAVLGESQGGKTSIVRRFVHRTSLHEAKKRGNNNKSSSVDYYKKDLAFWYNSSTVSCARIQVWDISSSISGNSSSSSAEERANTALLLQRTKAIVLVQSLEHGLDHVVEQAHIWKDRLSADADDHPKPIYWFLHKSDLLPSKEQNAPYWIHVGSTLRQVATDVLGVTDWFLTSCNEDNGDSIERAFMNLIRAQVDVDVARKVPTELSADTTASSSYSSSSAVVLDVKDG